MAKFIFTYNINGFLNENRYGSSEALDSIIRSLIVDGRIHQEDIVYSLERTFIITTDKTFEDMLRLIRQVTEAVLRPQIEHFYYHISPIPLNDRDQEMYNPENRNGNLQEYFLNRCNRILNG